MRRLLISFLITLAVGIGLLYYAARLVEHNRAAREAAYQAAATAKKPDYAITIIEGKRREEIAQQLDAAGITTYADFMAASAGKEGMLFPDTYRFFKDTPATQVVATLTSTYANRVAGLNPTVDQLILASIVEREAANDSQRPTIAGIYANRLRLGMPLEADPTVQYAKDNASIPSTLPNPVTGAASPQFKYWGTITQDDYHGVSGPYNTYLHAGLPPTPICNPGLKSIEAAISPEKNDYLYFINKDGKLLLAKTLAQHLAQENE